MFHPDLNNNEQESQLSFEQRANNWKRINEIHYFNVLDQLSIDLENSDSDDDIDSLSESDSSASSQDVVETNSLMNQSWSTVLDIQEDSLNRRNPTNSDNQSITTFPPCPIHEQIKDQAEENVTDSDENKN